MTSKANYTNFSSFISLSYKYHFSNIQISRFISFVILSTSHIRIYAYIYLCFISVSYDIQKCCENLIYTSHSNERESTVIRCYISSSLTHEWSKSKQHTKKQKQQKYKTVKLHNIDANKWLYFYEQSAVCMQKQQQ